MKVKYLAKVGQHKAGTEVVQDEASARWLIDRGLAEEVTESKGKKRSKNDHDSDGE